MKKSNFVALVLGTIGGVLFALGMCMTLLPEWGLETPGIVCGVTGLAVLAAAPRTADRGRFYFARATAISDTAA